jgi:hypothetical protein
MEKINVQIIETLVALATYVVLKQLLQYAVRTAVMKSYFKISEKKEVMKIINLISFVVLLGPLGFPLGFPDFPFSNGIL